MKKIILIILGIIFSTIIVFANSMAPTSIPGKTGILVDKESGIELMDETIIITIDETLNKTHYLVNYTFKNINKERIETPIMFLSRGSLHSHDFKVYINNIETKSEAKKIKASAIENWEPEDEFNYIDPFTDDVFDSTIDRYSSEHILVDAFDLKMESGQTSDVVIEYERWNGYISPRVTNYMNDVKLASYMLSPAAFYEGEGQVDIKIVAPLNTILKSNIKLEKKDDQSYEIKDYQLKEDENLYLSFSKEPDISELFAYDKTGFKLRLLALQILLLIAIVIIKNVKLKKVLGFVFIISFIAYLSVVSYGMIFNVILFSFLMIPVLIILWVIHYIRSNNHSNS